MAIVVAGAAGVTWFTSQKSNVADGQVAERTIQSPSVSTTDTPSATAGTSSPPQQVLASPTGPDSLADLSVDVSQPAKMMVMSEQWIVKAGAKIEEFPVQPARLVSLSCLRNDYSTIEAFENCVNKTPGCTPQQREWLAENAIPNDVRDYAVDGRMHLGSVTLTNKSTSPQSLSFKDIRLKAEFAPISDAGYSITCTNYNDWSGGATAGFANSREVVIPPGAGTGVFGGPAIYGEDLTRNIPEGMPAVFNLAAGETSNVDLVVKVPFPVGTVTGGVYATVVGADGEREIPVSVSMLATGAASYVSLPRTTLWIDGGALCPPDPPKTKKYSAREICSIPQLLSVSRHG
ncbi:hypothetical protein CVCC1112_185 [Paenarthrobacter nicotinovorans]|nr:hypothetical protein CVCC1112_185 [Paenarthrobacter nicotinovorans]